MCAVFVLGSGSNGVWIELTYTNGDVYNNHCKKSQRMARIMFLCDPAINGNVSFSKCIGLYV